MTIMDFIYTVVAIALGMTLSRVNLLALGRKLVRKIADLIPDGDDDGTT